MAEVAIRAGSRVLSIQSEVAGQASLALAKFDTGLAVLRLARQVLLPDESDCASGTDNNALAADKFVVGAHAVQEVGEAQARQAEGRAGMLGSPGWRVG